MAEELVKKHCKPCEGGVPPLSSERAHELMKSVEEWQFTQDQKSIIREFIMENFSAAIKFINEIAKTAEKEGHHPDLYLTGYRKLKVVLSTHAIGGLSENDFILAAKIDGLPKELKAK